MMMIGSCNIAVLQMLFDLSAAQIYAQIRAGRIPRPEKIGHSAMWNYNEVAEIARSQGRVGGRQLFLPVATFISSGPGPSSVVLLKRRLPPQAAEAADFS
jgi:predicted DNA-binding transcriptional regulator AlpA